MQLLIHYVTVEYLFGKWGKAPPLIKGILITLSNTVADPIFVVEFLLREWLSAASCIGHIDKL